MDDEDELRTVVSNIAMHVNYLHSLFRKLYLRLRAIMCWAAILFVGVAVYTSEVKPAVDLELDSSAPPERAPPAE